MAASRPWAALLAVAALVLVSSSVPRVMAGDPSPLQDFCVADLMNPVFVNGFVCKNPKLVTPNDFFLRAGLNKPGMLNPLGSAVTLVSVLQLPGLNTLGISLARIDYGPNGLNPPHTHPRGSEILTVIKGQLLVGFVTSNQPDGRNLLFTKQLAEGDVFVFPQGLIHFQLNNGLYPAVAIAALSSQNAGTITIANAVFGSTPPISDLILAKAFMTEKDTVDWIQSQFAPAMSGGGGNYTGGGGGGNYTGGGGGGYYPGMRKKP